MKLQRQLSILALALAAALPVALPTAAVAQSAASAAEPWISTLGVEPVRRLRPGNVLVFRLSGTPGATVSLQIAGATRAVALREGRPGEYAGDYTIRSADKLSASSSVTARLLKNGRTTSAMLGSSLLLGARDLAPVATTPIGSFKVTAAEGLQPGDELLFSLLGKPGGAARVAVQGVDRRLALTEVRHGVYEGSYVLRRGDRLQNALVVDGFLLNDGRETSQRFEGRLDTGASGKARSDNDNGVIRNPAAAACANCGAIESIRIVEVKSDAPNVIGTIAGGVLGGVVGNQVGGGSGKDLATLIGAVGGAYAGNRVESQMGKKKVFRVAVRLDGGSTQDFDYANDPAVQLGTRVKVEDGVLMRL